MQRDVKSFLFVKFAASMGRTVEKCDYISKYNFVHGTKGISTLHHLISVDEDRVEGYGAALLGHRRLSAAALQRPDAAAAPYRETLKDITISNDLFMTINWEEVFSRQSTRFILF